MMTETATTAPSPPAVADDRLEAVTATVRDELARVNNCIQARLHSDIALINEVSAYLINSGGKRLRPLLLLLSARAFCPPRPPGDTHITLAAALELIHSATLLHDDVVDTSAMRRGNPAASRVWGNPASVLIGDFLYSRAVEMLSSVGNLRVVSIMAETTNTIAVGEVLQLQNSLNIGVGESQYFEIIRSKTAKLFESAALLGAVLGEAGFATERAMAAYGVHLGIAFQLMDDVLDYSGAREQLGKNRGDDLAEGKITLPVIHAMEHGGRDQHRLLRRAIEGDGRALFEQVVKIIESTGSLAYTARRARDQAQLARKALAGISAPPTARASLQTLSQLADFAVERAY